MSGELEEPHDGQVEVVAVVEVVEGVDDGSKVQG